MVDAPPKVPEERFSNYSFRCNECLEFGFNLLTLDWSIPRFERPPLSRKTDGDLHTRWTI